MATRRYERGTSPSAKILNKYKKKGVTQDTRFTARASVMYLVAAIEKNVPDKTFVLDILADAIKHTKKAKVTKGAEKRSTAAKAAAQFAIIDRFIQIAAAEGVDVESQYPDISLTKDERMLLEDEMDRANRFEGHFGYRPER